MKSMNQTERARVRARIRRFFELFQERDWAGCYDLLDPSLRNEKVTGEQFARLLADFYQAYGPIQLVKIEELTLHEGVEKSKYGPNFAYGLVLWRDKRHEAHLLKERWVKTGDTWYSRRVGLVVPSARSSDPPSSAGVFQ
jgi:hypothetical protein